MRFLLAFFILWSSSVQASDTLPPECRFLVQHKPATGVLYQPGVDVHGKPVVPATSNHSSISMPDVIRVPLTVDIIERVRDGGGQYQGLEGQGQLGIVEIHRDGLVTYNGEDWTQNFHDICGLKTQSPGFLPEPQKAMMKEPEILAPITAHPMKDEERVIFGGGYQ